MELDIPTRNCLENYKAFQRAAEKAYRKALAGIVRENLDSFFSQKEYDAFKADAQKTLKKNGLTLPSLGDLCFKYKIVNCDNSAKDRRYYSLRDNIQY